MPDERKRRPSASSAERYDLCRASFLAEQEAEPEDTTADADYGTKVHAFLEGKPVELTAAEESTALRAQELETGALREFSGGLPFIRYRERRLWFRDEEFQKLWSGKPDLVALIGARGLVLDYKALWGNHTPAPSNLQLRALAVLVAEEHLLEEVTVVLVQPNAWPSVTRATYTAADLEKARSEIAALMETVQRQGHPRTPSPKACRFCRARSTCTEAQALAFSVSELPRTGRAITVTPEQLADLLERSVLAEQMVDAIRGKARRMIQAGIPIPGWTLEPGPAREDIVDVPTVFARFQAAGGDETSFLPAVKITKSGLLDAFRTVSGLKGKALEAKLSELLAGTTETKPTAAQLTRA